MTGPLSGLKVIDITTVMMGPYATQIMAEMGADVLKIEAPEGDSVRGVGPSRNPGMGSLFLQANAGKRSVVLNLKTEEGRANLTRLAAAADVLITNLRPKALKRLGLSYAELSSVNPRLIFASLFGYGEDGPYAGRPAYDDLIQGAVGIPSLFVAAGGEAPRYAPVTVSDRVVGLFGLSAILASLWRRERTGEGQSMEIPMFETMAHFVLGDHLGGALFDPPEASMGYARLLSDQRRPYPTRDGFVCTMIYNDDQWRRFFAAIGRSEMFETDPRFATIADRTRHIDDIYAMVADEMASRSTEECVALLNSADLPFAPLNTLESLRNDPHLAATGFFREVEHPSEGRLRTPTHPVRYSRTPPAPVGPAPRLGEHTSQVLGELQSPPSHG